MALLVHVSAGMVVEDDVCFALLSWHHATQAGTPPSSIVLGQYVCWPSQLPTQRSTLASKLLHIPDLVASR